MSGSNDNFNKFRTVFSIKYIISMNKDKITTLETWRFKKESKSLTFATEKRERERVDFNKFRTKYIISMDKDKITTFERSGSKGNRNQ